MNNQYPNNPQQAYPQQGYGAPAVPLKTNRSAAKFILLGLITFMIYPLVVMCGISTDINVIASRYDGKKTMHFALVAFIFTGLTLGIVPLVWQHRICNRMGDELRRRGINYDFSASTFWIFGFLLSFTVVCPIIYLHKMLTAMNLLCENYNQVG